MKKILSIEINKTTTTYKPDSYVLGKNEYTLYDDTVRVMQEKQDYSIARRELLEEACKKSYKDYGTEKADIGMDKIAKIHETYFKPELKGKELDYSNLNQALKEFSFNNMQEAQSQIKAKCSLSAEIIGYLEKIIKSMTDESYNTLLELSLNFKNILFLAIHHVIVTVIGYKNYLENLPYLISESGLHDIFEQCRNYHLTKLHTVPFLSDFYNIPYIKPLGLIAAIIIIAPHLAPIVYGSFNYISEHSIRISQDTISNSKTTKLSVPKFITKRLGFDNDIFKNFRNLVFKVSAEITQIVASAYAGAAAGVAIVLQARIEEYTGNPDEIIIERKDNKIVKISTSKTSSDESSKTNATTT
jgi:hypothetical protein